MLYKSFNIGNRFCITPPGVLSNDNKRIDLVMQRGAFGSGEHETTENCLELMECLPQFNGARVLDLGSGTGILAIAALKLGAEHAVCVDIEPKAVETAQKNCKLNELESRTTHIVGTLDNVREDHFDIILANIYGDILLKLAPALIAKLRQEGTILLSGILWEYNFDVRQAYERQGCRVIKNKLLKEFSSVLFQKSP